MNDLLSNALRGSVTAVMNVLLLFTLTKGKHGNRSMIIAVAIVFIIDITSTFYLYLTSDLTTLSRVNLATILILGVVLKPFFKESFSQWIFKYLTATNIMMIIIFISFHAGKFFPYPQYAHTLIRLLLYILVILLFQYRLLPIYQETSQNWPIFSALVFCIFLTLSYYFWATTNIQRTLATSRVPMLLLSLLAAVAYGTVFSSLKRLSALHELEMENLRMQSDRALLSQAAATMGERLALMDQVAQQHSIASHDRRHYNGMLLRLLEQGDAAEAIASLTQQIAAAPTHGTIYCHNKAVQAVTAYHTELAKSKGIRCEVDLDIPASLPFDSVELALVVANLLENAIEAVSSLPDEREKSLRFVCIRRGRLMLEISNPCSPQTKLGPDGLPQTSKSGHGIGTKSVVAFAVKHQAELLYRIEEGIFIVRLLIEADAHL